MSSPAKTFSSDLDFSQGVAPCHRVEFRWSTHRPTRRASMFRSPVRRDQTIARYEIDATKFIGQYCREHPAEVCDAPYESRVAMAVVWFLSSHGRWSDSYIRLVAAALSQRVEMLVMM